MSSPQSPTPAASSAAPYQALATASSPKHRVRNRVDNESEEPSSRDPAPVSKKHRTGGAHDASSASSAGDTTVVVSSKAPDAQLREFLEAYPKSLQIVMLTVREKEKPDKHWFFSVEDLEKVFEYNLASFNEDNEYSLLMKLCDDEVNFDEAGWMERKKFMDDHACGGDYFAGQGVGALKGQILVATRIACEEDPDDE